MEITELIENKCDHKSSKMKELKSTEPICRSRG
jgi:hypothetical protein